MGVYRRESVELEFADDSLGEVRGVDAGGITISFEQLRAGFTTEPLAKGLPGDACTCQHWGYLLKGRFRILTAAGEEVVEAGQAYHMEPGHNVVIDQDVELVEFSPTGERRRVGEHFMANAAALVGS
jgi:hypothetical protein